MFRRSNGCYFEVSISKMALVSIILKQKRLIGRLQNGSANTLVTALLEDN